MNDNDVLNPRLYDALESWVSRHGGKLEVHRRGMEIGFEEQLVVSSKANRDTRREVTVRGEEMSINCPFCRDTRGRLSISYMWAVPDEYGNNLWLMRCYNEECQNNYENRVALKEFLFSYNRPPRRNELRKGVVVVKEELKAVAPPGPITGLHKLPSDHPAVAYIRERGFDPTELSTKHKIGYCEYSPMRLAANRLYFPVYMYDMLVGWQTRLLGAHIKDGPPKYWGCPDMMRRLIAFNYEEAITHPVVLIVEGCLDAIRSGPNAMALMGKTIGHQLATQLVDDLTKDAVVGIMLDPKQDEKAEARGDKHHQFALLEKLSPLLPGRVFNVWLPDHLDPGTATPKQVDMAVRAGAKVAGIKLPERQVQLVS